MSNILVTYSARTPTVDLVMGLIWQFADHFGVNVIEKDSGEVSEENLNWCDSVLMIRPFDTVCSDIVKAVKKNDKFLIVYLDDDLLHVPALYASLLRKIIALILKKKNQNTLLTALSQCDVLWGSNPLLLEKYKRYVTNGRCIKCDVVADISHMKNPPDPADKPHILFAGASDHAALLNKYIVPALNQLAPRFPELQMTCVGISEIHLQPCKVKMNFIPWMNDYEQYRKVVGALNCNIGIAVIDEDEFFHYKYFNKFIEYSLLGAVGIYTDSDPYRLVVRHGENGFLAESSVLSWQGQIAYAIEHPDIGAACVRNAQSFIKKEFCSERLLEQLDKAIPELHRDSGNHNKKVIYHQRVVWNFIRKAGTALVETYEACIAKVSKNHDRKN